MLKTISIVINGKVQGVFFRQSTRETAELLGITGIVSNLPDGSVAVVATGDERQLESFKSWCKKGPPRAVVTSLEIKELAFQTFRNFSIHYF